MISVTMPRAHWRTIHAALVECALMWDAGVSTLTETAGRQEVDDIMQRVLPIIAQASAWPNAARMEAAARERLGLPVPEDMLEAARGLVREWEDPEG